MAARVWLQSSYPFATHWYSWPLSPVCVLGQRQKPMFDRCLHYQVAGSVVLIAFTAATLMWAHSLHARLKKALPKN